MRTVAGGSDGKDAEQTVNPNNGDDRGVNQTIVYVSRAFKTIEAP